MKLLPALELNQAERIRLSGEAGLLFLKLEAPRRTPSLDAKASTGFLGPGGHKQAAHPPPQVPFTGLLFTGFMMNQHHTHEAEVGMT